jgi:hypothetical protein
MISVLKAAGHTHPSKVAAHMWQVLHQPQLKADVMTTRTKSRLRLALVGQLLPLVEEISDYDKEIRRWASTRLEPWAKEYSQRKRKEGQSQRMAVRALANVWVRMIFAMWSKHEGSQTATLLAAQQSHRRPTGSRRDPSADGKPLPAPLQRLPRPDTAFPTPAVGCSPQTTPSQGRAGGRALVGGRARLGLDRRGTLAHPHERQLHFLSPYFLLSSFDP